MALKAKLSCVAERTLLSVVTFSIAFLAFANVIVAQSQQPQQAGAQHPAQKTIETLAVVNGQPISRHQIADECMRRYGQDVLEDRIKKMLVLDQCRKSGIVITEKDVNDELVEKAKSFGMSGDKYVQMLVERRGISVDRLKNDITWHDLAIRRLASQNIQITQEEINERMEFEFGPKVQVRQLVVDSVQQATQIREQLLQTPENFERMGQVFGGFVKQHITEPAPGDHT